MKNCINCGLLLDPGDWWVENESWRGTPDFVEEVTCDKCHKMYEESERRYQASLRDVEMRESELAEMEGGDLY